jgi:hypothetical protein
LDDIPLFLVWCRHFDLLSRSDLFAGGAVDAASSKAGDRDEIAVWQSIMRETSRGSRSGGNPPGRMGGMEAVSFTFLHNALHMFWLLSVYVCFYSLSIASRAICRQLSERFGQQLIEQM